MLQASSERPLPAAAGRLWVPGMSTHAAPYVEAAPSARALEIARRRDEMLGMLHGLPEAEYELSLTDLVEKTGAAAVVPPPTPPSERKEASPSPSPMGKPAGLVSEQPAPAKTERRGSSRRRGDGGSGSGRSSSFRSSSDGVLLNFYMPRSLTRSFTSPRPTHHAPPVSDDSNKRERDSDTVKCWSMPWDRRWRKSSRRDLAGESEAILNNSSPQDKV